MYEYNTVTNVDVLQIFHSEAERLDEAIGKYFKVELFNEDGELFKAGTRLYERVDPIIERGVIATSRLLIVKGETASFQSVCKLIDKPIRPKDRLKLELLKLNFHKLRKDTNELFDLFWNIEHLHKDISDHRFKKYSSLKHSCLGPGTTTQLYDALIEVNTLINKLDGEYVKPLLRKAGRLN